LEVQSCVTTGKVAQFARAGIQITFDGFYPFLQENPFMTSRGSAPSIDELTNFLDVHFSKVARPISIAVHHRNADDSALLVLYDYGSFWQNRDEESKTGS
jgi:hypothetical protein